MYIVILNEILNEIKCLDLETRLAQVVEAICKSLFLRPDMDKKFVKVTDEVGKAIRAASEIINSVEDLKQITSSIPGACYELGPKIEKLQCCIKNSEAAICAKLTSTQDEMIKECSTVMTVTQQESLEHINSKFDLVENM